MTAKILEDLLTKIAVPQVQRKRGMTPEKRKQEYAQKKNKKITTHLEATKIVGPIAQALLSALLKAPKNQISYVITGDFDGKKYKFHINLHKFGR